MAFRPDSCLFVANLPHQLSNEELGYQLYNLFKPFGSIEIVKASRDSNGRPFGFVQFNTSEDARKAGESGILLYIHGRLLRIERAKCQRKLYIKTCECTESTLHTVLKKYSQESCNFKIFVEDNKAGSTTLSAILKFPDDNSLTEAQTELKEQFPKWTINWLHPNRTNSNSFILKPEIDPIPFSTTPTPFMFMGWNEVLPISPELSPVREEKHQKMESRSNEIFVGRLNREMVSEECLTEYFSKYGTIININLVRRDEMLSHAPLDAFAFIQYESIEAANAAVENENGKVWLGQAIKVNWALPHGEVGLMPCPYYFPLPFVFPYYQNINPSYY